MASTITPGGLVRLHKVSSSARTSTLLHKASMCTSISKYRTLIQSNNSNQQGRRFLMSIEVVNHAACPLASSSVSKLSTLCQSKHETCVYASELHLDG